MFNSYHGFFSYPDLSGFFMVLAQLLPLVGLAMYVLRSIGLYQMSRHTGVLHPWFAWIPLLHEYQCAKIGDRTRLAQGKSAFLEKWMLVGAAAYVLLQMFSGVFGHIFLIGTLYRLVMGLVSLGLLALAVLADYWMYVDFEPSMCALYALLSVFRLDGIPKILLRNNVPVGVAGVGSPKQPKYAG